MNSLSEANTRFAYDLFQQFRKSKKKNIFYSPLSITSALAITYLGSKGHTASEIQKALHFDEVTDNTKDGAAGNHAEKSGNMHQQFQKLLTELSRPTDDYELSVANGLYGEKEFRFLQEYMDNVKKFYRASVESADFQNAAEESRKMINSWVESQTKDKIKDLFPEHSIHAGTVLVLVNAVYFKGQWDHRFDPKATEPGQFWLSKGESKPVQMMKQSHRFNFASLEGARARVLEVPYRGGDLSMLLLLPDDIDGLGQLEDKLTAEKLTEWTSPQNMSEQRVELLLPRFRVEETYELQGTLRALGVGDAFSAQDADFSGMTGRRGLVVSRVLHKSFVEVTEEGTEAAAATEVTFVLYASPFRNVFCCDRPFLFCIRHNKTDSLLFLGRVSCP